MQRWLLTTVATALLPGAVFAVDLKNPRPCHGPIGVTRYDTKLLPGDFLFMTYDIEGLVLDKAGKANYVTILELLDAQQKEVFKKETPNELEPPLGGNRMPGDLSLILSAKQAPGRYALKLTVHDKNGNDAKAFKYEFDVIPESFGMVGVTAPAVGFYGQNYAPGFALVNLTLGADKQPNVEVTVRVTGPGGTPVAPPKQIVLPRDMPSDSDLQKANIVPLAYPLYLNRVGTYTMEISAIDKIANKRSDVRFQFTAVDVSTFLPK